jgi:hypothetical protein
MVAVGRLGLSYNDLFYYTLEDLDLMLKGKDEEMKVVWEAARLAGVISAGVHLQKKKRMKPQDFYRFPWELKDAPKFTDEKFEQGKKLFEKWQQVYKSR